MPLCWIKHKALRYFEVHLRGKHRIDCQEGLSEDYFPERKKDGIHDGRKYDR